MAIIKKAKVTSAGSDAEKNDSCVLLMGMCVSITVTENGMEFPQKLKI